MEPKKNLIWVLEKAVSSFKQIDLICYLTAVFICSLGVSDLSKLEQRWSSHFTRTVCLTVLLSCWVSLSQKQCFSDMHMFTYNNLKQFSMKYDVYA